MWKITTMNDYEWGKLPLWMIMSRESYHYEWSWVEKITNIWKIMSRENYHYGWWWAGEITTMNDHEWGKLPLSMIINVENYHFEWTWVGKITTLNDNPWIIKLKNGHGVVFPYLWLHRQVISFKYDKTGRDTVSKIRWSKHMTHSAGRKR